MLRAEKEVRSCGSIVGGSVVPAYYDGRDFDAKCKDLGVSDEKASDGDDDGDSSVAQGPEGRYMHPTVARAPGGAKDRR